MAPSCVVALRGSSLGDNHIVFDHRSSIVETPEAAVSKINVLMGGPCPCYLRKQYARGEYVICSRHERQQAPSRCYSLSSCRVRLPVRLRCRCALVMSEPSATSASGITSFSDGVLTFLLDDEFSTCAVSSETWQEGHFLGAGPCLAAQKVRASIFLEGLGSRACRCKMRCRFGSMRAPAQVVIAFRPLPNLLAIRRDKLSMR